MATSANRVSRSCALETFAESFAATCLRQPNYPVVCSDGESWTYGELNHAARAVAGNLLRLVPMDDRPVAIRLSRGLTLVAAIVGAVLARRCFVVIDPDYPTERNLQVLEDADPALVIVSGSEDAPLVGDRPHVVAAELLKVIGVGEFEALHGHPDDLACLVYTSGSTGKPKAAMVTHGAIAQIGYIQTKLIGVIGSDRHAMLHSATTIGGMRTLFGALFAGATLFPYEISTLGVRPLADWLERNRITVIHTAATVVRHFLLTLGGPRKFPDVRLMIFGAERVFWDDVRIARSIFSDEVEMWNGLGASETGTMSGWLIPSLLPLGEGLVPLGHAVDGVSLRLVDENGAGVPNGEIGEIEARGRYISLGYWHRSELTGKSFCRAPTGDRIYRTGDLARRLPNGMLVHSGRRDFVAKINGVRVDMGEVETAIARDPAVVECAVVCESVTPGDCRLHAFVEAAPGVRLSDTGLRELAARALLPAMRPTFYWQVSNWPRTPNGKLNRRALLEWSDRSPVSNETGLPEDQRVADLEFAIAASWQKVMPGRKPGRNEDFFASGGTSLMAIELIQECRARLNRHIPGELLFRSPTIAGLARALQAVPGVAGRGAIVTLQTAGEAPPLYCICGIQLYAELARHLAPNIPVHGVYLPWEEAVLEATIDASTLTVERMAASYVETIREHRPSGPYLILGISFGGVLAYEVARQLSSAGQEVRWLALLDCLRPGGSIVPWYRKPLWVLKRLVLRKPPKLPPDTSPGLIQTAQEESEADARLSTYRGVRAKYAPRSWNGPAVLFRARHTIRYRHLGLERGYGWNTIIPDLKAVDVPGDHLGILRQAGAVEIAHVLRSMTIPRHP